MAKEENKNSFTDKDLLAELQKMDKPLDEQTKREILSNGMFTNMRVIQSGPIINTSELINRRFFKKEPFVKKKDIPIKSRFEILDL